MCNESEVSLKVECLVLYCTHLSYIGLIPWHWRITALLNECNAVILKIYDLISGQAQNR